MNETPSTNGTQKHENRAHSELGGSSAARWSQCPGSVFLGRTLPPQPSSPAAKEGTKAHELAEVCLRDFLSHKLHGTDPEAQFSLLAVGADVGMVEAAEAYRAAIWTKVLEQALTNKAFAVEDHLWFDKDRDMGGIVDFWAAYVDDRARRVGIILDFKYGYSYVDVKRNGQLAFYSCALRRFLREHGKDLDLVRAAIFQPRCVHHEPFRETVFTTKQLDSWEKKFVKAAHQIYVKKKATYKVGDWCKFCPAQAICPKYSKELSAVSELSLVNVDEVKLPEPETLTDEQLSKLILSSDKIEAFIKACKVFALNKHMMGKQLPGLKVVLGSQRRKWRENEDEIGEQLKALGCDPWNKKLKPLTEIQRKLGKDGKNILEPFVTLTAAKPVLVSTEDERPAVENCLDLLGDSIEDDN